MSSTNGFSDGRKVTTTALKRWSCKSVELPPVPQIKSLHVYDFDNTLFRSPLPNPQLWNSTTLSRLRTEDGLLNGGWWHDPNLLAATGKGIEAEEPIAWEGWWNEQIVQLVRLSMEQSDALAVLLTGRKESRFASLIKRMVDSKGLNFDMICLKPEAGPNSQQFQSTMVFKQNLLEDLMLTYTQADEIRIYEDRLKHVIQFRDFLDRFNFRVTARPPSRKPIAGDVIEVAEDTAYLDPVVEASEIQRMVNNHNQSIQLSNGPKNKMKRLQIKRTVFLTGYLLSCGDSSRLVETVLKPMLPPNYVDSDIKIMATNILITPRPAAKTLLQSIGGIGKSVKWQVTGTAILDQKIWAARVAPVDPNQRVYTDNPELVVVMALRKGGRPADVGKIQHFDAIAPDRALVFDSTIGQKMVLRIEEEHPGEDEYESLFQNKNAKRKQLHDGENAPAFAARDARSYHRHNFNNSTNNYNNNSQDHYSHPGRRHLPPHVPHRFQPDDGSHPRYHHNNHPHHHHHHHYHENAPRRGGGTSYRGGRGQRGGRGGGGGGGGGAGGAGGAGSGAPPRYHNPGGAGRGRGGGGGGGGGFGPGPSSYKSLDESGVRAGFGGYGYDGPGDGMMGSGLNY